MRVGQSLRLVVAVVGIAVAEMRRCVAGFEVAVEAVQYQGGVRMYQS